MCSSIVADVNFNTANGRGTLARDLLERFLSVVQTVDEIAGKGW